MVAFADLAAIFDAVRAAVAGASSEPLGPSRPAEDYLPTPASLEQRFTSGTLDPSELLLEMLLVVAPRWIEVRTGGIAELERIGAHAQAMTGSSATEPPGIPFRYRNFAFRLSLDITAPASGGPVAMRRLVEADGAALDTLLTRLTSTPARAVGAVMALRRFDDVLIRVLAARLASQATGLPVARIVTLHRLEGNLCVFPSDASLELWVPSAAGIDLPTGLGHEPMLINQTMRPAFGHLVWLADAAAAQAMAGTETLPTFALSWAFMLHAIGGDRVAQGLNQQPMIDHFARWSTDNRMALGASIPYSSRLNEARLRWGTLLGLMQVRTVAPHDGSGAPQAVRMAPTDPVAFLAGILAEGAMYQDALFSGSWLTGAPTNQRLPEGLAAARYNWQATPEGMAATIYSALAAARNGSSGALKAAIASDAALTAKLKAAAVQVQTSLVSVKKRTKALSAAERTHQINKEMRAVHAAAISALPPFAPMDPGYADSIDQLHLATEVRDWLLQGDHLQRLGSYFDTVGTGAWGSYSGLRRYGMTERRLYDFYSRVFP